MLISPGGSVDQAAMALLGDPLRARIVGLLADEQMCTCHLIEETGARQPTVSHHLKILRESGLVDTEPRGRYTYYRLRPDVLAGLSGALQDLADRAERAQGNYRPC